MEMRKNVSDPSMYSEISDKDKVQDKRSAVNPEQESHNRRVIFEGVRSNIKNSKLLQKILTDAKVFEKDKFKSLQLV